MQVHTNIWNSQSQGGVLEHAGVFLENTALSGTIPPSIAEISTLYELRVTHNFISGTLPTTLRQMPELCDLKVEYNLFDWTSSALSTELCISPGRCANSAGTAGDVPAGVEARRRCEGLPPNSCRGFANAVQSITHPRECVVCNEHSLREAGLAISFGASLIVLTALFIFALVRKPTKLIRRWGSTVSLLINHAQTLAILEELGHGLPPFVNKVFAFVSLNVFYVPELACWSYDSTRWVQPPFPEAAPGGLNFPSTAYLNQTPFTSNNAIENPPSQENNSSTFAFYFFGVTWGTAVIQLFMVLYGSLARRCGSDEATDKTEMALTIVYGLTLPLSWHAILRITFGQIMTIGDGSEGAETILFFWCLLCGPVVMLQIGLALHFRREINHYQAGIERGVWHTPPSSFASLLGCAGCCTGCCGSAGYGYFCFRCCERSHAPIRPRRLARRVFYLTGRFAPHAPRWQFVIWARLLALGLLVAGSGLAQRLYSAPGALYKTQNVTVPLSALVIIVFWYAQQRYKPYAYRYQNTLESLLHASLLLTTALQAIGAGVDDSTTMDILISTSLLGGLLCGLACIM